MSFTCSSVCGIQAIARNRYPSSLNIILCSTNAWVRDGPNTNVEWREIEAFARKQKALPSLEMGTKKKSLSQPVLLGLPPFSNEHPRKQAS